jgi:hypothetical protein
MGMAWGFVVVALSVVCWGGQAVSWLAPATAVRFSLAEGEDTVDPTFFADVRGEALWDTLTLWTMPVAGVLLIADNAAWTYFGLVGGAMYLYFAGRGVFTRIAMRRRGVQIGTRQNVMLGLVFLSIWGAMGLVTMVAAVVSLTS